MQKTLALAVCLLCLFLSGQTQIIHSDFQKQDCLAPSIISKSVLHFDTEVQVFLQFKNALQNNPIIISRDGLNMYSEKSTTNELSFTGLEKEQVYELKTLDDCGRTRVIATISTRAEDRTQHGIEVSVAMHQLILDFQQNEKTPLYDMIVASREVSIYEKMALVQQFYLDGRPYALSQGYTLPNKSAIAQEKGNCSCNFLFVNPVQLASPGDLNAGTIAAEDFGGPVTQSTYYNDDSGRAYGRRSKGPAKYHYLHNGGFKAGVNVREESYMVLFDDALSSPHQAQLIYNYVCKNYLDLPANCYCEKEIDIFYRYDTRVAANADTRPANQNKYASAISEDMAIVTVRQGVDGQPVPIAAGDARAAAECQTTINPDWWVELLDVGSSIVSFFDDDQDDLTQNAQNLASSLSDIITTPYYNDVDCNSVTVEETLLNGSRSITLIPNQPVWVNLFSYTNQVVRGKRSWYADAWVNSSFYLAGIVQPGYRNAPITVDCCTDKYGNWVLGSENGPLNYNNLYTLLGGDFAAFQPWNLPTDPWSGVIQLPSEYGYTSIEQECGTKPEDPKEPKEPGLQSPADEASKTLTASDPILDRTELTDLAIFDSSGRLLLYLEQQDVTAKTNWTTLLREQTNIDQAGIYFVSLIKPTGKEVIKVMLPKR